MFQTSFDTHKNLAWNEEKSLENYIYGIWYLSNRLTASPSIIEVSFKILFTL